MPSRFNKYTRRQPTPEHKSRHYKDHTYSRDRTSRTSSQDEKRYPRHSVHHNDSQSSSPEYDSKGEPYKRAQSRHSRRHAKDRSCHPSSGDESSSSEQGRRRKQSRQPRRFRRKGSPCHDRAGDDSDKHNPWYSDDSSSPNDDSVRVEGARRQLRIKLQKFDGTGSWESWWAHFQNCAEYNQWSSRDKLAFLKGALTGNAAQVLWDTDRATTGSLRKLVSMLRSRYSGERQAEKYRAELQIRRRKPHESLSDLHHDIRRLMALAYPKLNADAREEIACDHFTTALSDPELALKVKERVPRSLDDALRIALRLEAWAKTTKMSVHDDDRMDRTKQKMRATGQQETANQKFAPQSQANGRISKIESDVARMSTDVAKVTYDVNKQYEELKQLITQKQPRTRIAQGTPIQSAAPQRIAAPPAQQAPEPQTFAGDRQTPQPASAQQAGNAYINMHPMQQSNTVPSFSCWHCGLPGHISRNCPMRIQGTTYPPPPNETANRGSRQEDKANVYVRMTLFGKVVPCLVDSGCETTLVPKSLIDCYTGIDVWPSSDQVWAANNTTIDIYGETKLPLVLEEQCIWTSALISDDVEEVMLGADWLQANRCVWDFGTGNLSINGHPAVTLTRKGHIRCRRVIVQEPLQVPPRSQVDVSARMTMLSMKTPTDDVMIETRQLRSGLYVGRTLLPTAERCLKVCVANTTNRPQMLAAGTLLGRPVVVSTMEDERPTLKTATQDAVNAEPVSAITEPVMSKLPPEVTAEQRQQVEDLLREYSDTFSTGTFDMGRTTLVEHTIDTGTQKPMRQALRRHPQAHLEEIDNQIGGLLEHGLIEPAASPWASNVVLVKKKDGSFRLCVDYRRLNSITYKDSYPLPHIDICLGSMNGAVWFSTLDLRSGYHNIPIKESDRDKTAFITRRGCFRYQVMPFGLTCAPSVFQRLMDLVLCGLTYETCLVYLDDIIVFSTDFATHLSRLREIFDRLRAANLKLHGKKCSFFQRRVDFLGHVLTESGIEVQPEKVEVVQHWPTPRNLRELRSFVGLCSYYRRFIAGFADIAAPLHALTQKNAYFRWGSEQDEAFRTLKDKLVSAPILGTPRDEGTYCLDTDASDRGIGAVLSQEQDGQEVVLAYASRTLSRQERNYDVTRRELLAVVYGLKAYRQYLLGRQFVIRTDHSALQSLRRTPEPIGQQARWQTFIEQFSFTIMHRPGSRHRNADALSRRPATDGESDDEKSPERCANVTVTQATADDMSDSREQVQASAGESMSELQQYDPDIGPILRWRIAQNNQPRPEEVLGESAASKVLYGQWHSLVVIDEVLYRRAKRYHAQTSVLQLVVPSVRREEFIAKCHQGMTGGHRAFRSTLDQVHRRGYWLGWRKDVERYCRQCGNCNCYRRGHLPRTGPLQPMITGNIMERWHVDITGPHPRTARGSKYILTCVDAFSKWAEAFPIPNKEAKTIARVLVEQLFCRFGTPIALLTDNAKELDGRLMQEICRLLDIDKQHTSYYHPETNSVAERFHGTLNTMMGRVVSSSQHDWDLALPYVMAAYRATLHQSTGYTPNYLMFAHENKAPVDLMFGLPIEPTPTSYDNYSTEMEDRMKSAYLLVRQHLGGVAERMKRRYDLRVRPQAFQRGHWVLYFNPRKSAGKQQKWQRKYVPHLIVKELPPVNYLIQRSRRARPFIAHVDKLKSWITDNPPKSWLTAQPDDEGNVENPGDVILSNSRLPGDAMNNRTVDKEDDYGPTSDHPLQLSKDKRRNCVTNGQDRVNSEERTAISGDPTSVFQPRTRPPRAIQRPARYL